MFKYKGNINNIDARLEFYFGNKYSWMFKIKFK